MARYDQEGVIFNRNLSVRRDASIPARCGAEKKGGGDTKATAITASALSVLPEVLFILVAISAVTSVIVVTDLRPIVNHSLSGLSSYNWPSVVKQWNRSFTRRVIRRLTVDRSSD